MFTLLPVPSDGLFYYISSVSDRKLTLQAWAWTWVTHAGLHSEGPSATTRETGTQWQSGAIYPPW